MLQRLGKAQALRGCLDSAALSRLDSCSTEVIVRGDFSRSGWGRFPPLRIDQKSTSWAVSLERKIQNLQFLAPTAEVPVLVWDLEQPCATDLWSVMNSRGVTIQGCHVSWCQDSGSMMFKTIGFWGFLFGAKPMHEIRLT
eukprot:s146_g16.t1